MEKRKDVFLERTAVLRSQSSWETPSGFWIPQGYCYILDGMQSGGTKEGKDFPWEIVLLDQSSQFPCAVWKRIDIIFKILSLILLHFPLFVEATPAWSRKQKGGYFNFSCENKKHAYHESMFLEKKHKN